MHPRRQTILFQGDSITDGNRDRNEDDYRRIVRQLAEDYDAVFVPLQEAFNKASSGMDAAYWMWDGVHPTAVGHELIAREWLSIVQNSPLAIR